MNNIVSWSEHTDRGAFMKLAFPADLVTIVRDFDEQGWDDFTSMLGSVIAEELKKLSNKPPLLTAKG